MISFHGMTDVGRKREKNEDSFLVDPAQGVFLVADGMGGHLGGEFASQMAVKTVGETLKRFQEEPSFALLPNEVDSRDPAEQLRYAIRLASQRIFREANRSPHLRGMGTTVVSLLVREKKGFIANVGDSRAYLVRDNEIHQLTVDHSLVTEQLQAGFITEDEVKNHRLKNIITRSVGFQDEVEIDLKMRDLEEGDRYLLCSDGLTNMVSNEEIARIVSRGKSANPKSICEKLIDQANRKGGDDNISVILVAVCP